MNMDRYILGTAALGGVFGPVDPAVSVGTVLRALEYGFTAIDTAPAYGDAELFVGKALREWRGAKPVISTKVGRLRSYASDDGRYDYHPEVMERSVSESLALLGLPNVDVLFLHDPWAVPPEQVDAVIDQLRLFKRKGYAGRIGLGGNPPPSFAAHIDNGVFDVVMEFFRFTAINADALTDSIPKYHSLGVQPYMASPLHMGLLGRRFEEFLESAPSWLDPACMQKAAALRTVASLHGISLSTLAHRFVFFAPVDIKVVTGPSNLRELEETWKDILSGPLPEDVVDEIRLIQQKNVS